MGRYRTLKPRIRELLASEDWNERLTELNEIPARRAVGPLFALLLDKNSLVARRAVAGFGHVAARLADQSMEEGRVLMRMCMWRLNEESGNLGWGIPECMGEAMARHEGLAREFHTILASYVYCREECDGNYLDHPLLRRGVFWGLARLAEVRPEYVAPAVPFLVDALDMEDDPVNRGGAASALGLVLLLVPEEMERGCAGLERLAADQTEFEWFLNGEIHVSTVGEAARVASSKCIDIKDAALTASG